jgi:hypothetical protein
VKEICERYGVPYHSGKMAPMLKTVAQRLVKYSVPEREKWPIIGKMLSKKKPAIKQTAEPTIEPEVPLTVVKAA